MLQLNTYVYQHLVSVTVTDSLMTQSLDVPVVFIYKKVSCNNPLTAVRWRNVTEVSKYRRCQSNSLSQQLTDSRGKGE